MPVDLVRPDGTPANPNLVSMTGADEKRLLDALSPPIKKQIAKGIADLEARGLYKIEVHFGKNRSISSLSANNCAILVWESGRRFHGGGDDRMFWCGHNKDCSQPIKSDFFGLHHVVCPKCKRESFLSEQSKQSHLKAALEGGKDLEGIKRIPCICGERLCRITPPKLAAELAKIWYSLDCKADIYLKYHPSDIRYRVLEETAKTPEQIQKARRLRGLLIYPLANILKDTAAGASVEKRFLGLITA